MFNAVPARHFSPRALVAALALIVVSTASAARIDSGVGLDTPESQYRDVYCDTGQTEFLGTISVESYFAWTSGVDSGSGIPYSPENPGLPTTGAQWENRAGADMVVNFSPGDTDCDAQYRWIQAVVDGSGTIGTPPYLDPFNRDDGLPFYWTEDENADPGIGNGGLRFSDIPGQSATNIGNSISFEAALVQYCPDTMQLHWVAGFTWGYSIQDQVGPVLDTFSWTNGPSGTLTNLVTSWDGSDTPPNYAGDGTPDGWTFTDDCLCNCVPETNSGMLSLAGISIVGMGCVATRRRSSAA